MSEILDPRAAAIDWAARSLAYETGAETEDCAGLAESLVAIAEHHGVTDEALIEWIHHVPDDRKEWSAAEFRTWCEKYTKAREESEESWEASRALSEMRERSLC